MIPASQKDDAFLADAKTHRGDPGFRLWWLGQSGYLLQFAQQHALIDPYLSDSLTTKYAKTDKPHVRMSERVIDPRKLDFVDVVSSSHNHTDHFDPDTLRELPGVPIVVPATNIEVSKHRLNGHGNIFGIDAGESTSIGGFTFHAVPAAHEKIDRDSQGRCLYLGYVITFGKYAIYHSGDTVLFDGMIDCFRGWKIDVALLPINGNRPERRVAGNLWGREAAELAKAISAKVVIPCHYDMFEFNTEPTEEFTSTCQKIGQRYVILRGGERFDFV